MLENEGKMAEKYEIAIIYYKEIYDKIKKINLSCENPFGIPPEFLSEFC